MKKQMKFQKIFCFVMLISSALCFVFALGITTNLYNATLANGCVIITDAGEILEGVPGAEIYYEIQPFNKLLVRITIVMILLAVLQFVVRTNNRRKYYISNYVATGLQVIGCVAIAGWAIYELLYWREYFLTIDFEAWQQFAELYSVVIYSDSTFWFDIAIIMYGLNILCCAGMIFNLIWKIMLMRYEKQVLSGTTLVEGAQ